MTSSTIAIIGAGHLGSSLIAGLLRNGHPTDRLWASNPHLEKLELLQNQFHIHITTDNKQAAEAADIIIFAVKPMMLPEVVKELAPMIAKRKPLIISVAAGVREKNIAAWLGNSPAIVRAMPNIPAMIGAGATALFANTQVTSTQHKIAESILRAIGSIVWLPNESLLDVATALSGSGPAYFFLVMEALQQAAEQLGLDPETARLLTLQTGLGATRMAIESDASLTELRQQVTSPGGTTEKALSVLEENNLRGIFKEALIAATLRAKELAEILGEKK